MRIPLDVQYPSVEFPIFRVKTLLYKIKYFSWVVLMFCAGCGSGGDGARAAHESASTGVPDAVSEAAALNSAGAPLVLYTDVTVGPTTGGENGKGAYLSIF